MFYAILLGMTCSGFQCDIDIINQWQSSESFDTVKSQCEGSLSSDIGSNCMYYFEELYVENNSTD